MSNRDVYVSNQRRMSEERDIVDDVFIMYFVGLE